MSDPNDPDGWQKLDKKMLLIGPLQVLRAFAVPAVVAILGLGSTGIFSLMFLPLFIVVPVLLGALPWLTTRFRITETKFELHKGLVSKKQLTAPLERIRSVDLESSLLHRVLGLAKVEIGTGVDDTRITLDSLSQSQAAALRGVLLRRRAASAEPVDETGAPMEVPGTSPLSDGIDAPAPNDPAWLPAPPEQVLARIDWSWVRFAPFSLTKLALVAGAVGVFSQFIDDFGIFDQNTVRNGWARVSDVALPWIVVVLLIAGLVAWLFISTAGYAVQWWNLLLVREAGNLRLTAGLFTTRSTTLEEARVRGVALTEPWLLRRVGGAELATLATGVGSGGVTSILPPCPVAVATSVGQSVLKSDPPLLVPLLAHGQAARRRCHLRMQRMALVAIAAAIGSTIGFNWSPWLPVVVAAVLIGFAVLSAEAQYANLGHALTQSHLVAGSGVWQRCRTALECDGVIGWVVHQNFFQRRVGLATLIATTAAGAEKLEVRDLPLTQAVALADAATPGMLTEFASSSAP